MNSLSLGPKDHSKRLLQDKISVDDGTYIATSEFTL